MNKILITYINKHGEEKISNKHLIFINDLMKNKTISEWGVLYKLSNYIYKQIKNKETKTLKEIIDNFNYEKGNRKLP